VAYEETRAAAGRKENSESPGNGKDELHGMSTRRTFKHKKTQENCGNVYYA